MDIYVTFDAKNNNTSSSSEKFEFDQGSLIVDGHDMMIQMMI